MVAAQAGFQVILRERNEEGLDRAQAAISSFLDDQINRWESLQKKRKSFCRESQIQQPIPVLIM